jgi:hypothetical protein
MASRGEKESRGDFSPNRSDATPVSPQVVRCFEDDDIIHVSGKVGRDGWPAGRSVDAWAGCCGQLRPPRPTTNPPYVDRHPSLIAHRPRQPTRRPRHVIIHRSTPWMTSTPSTWSWRWPTWRR